MKKSTLQLIRKAEIKLGKKFTKRTGALNIKKAIRVTQLGNGFARFQFAPVTVAPFSFRSTAVNGNAYN
ncbi:MULTISPECIES: hypothetical protein [unclassified Paenibacillus]|uniref:hypothetical protein n=1 Tax=unclassified Paenibacillus TaxID=185978 RepID=UPI0027D80BBF|nr:MULTISPECIES: hypothetical protein [unclassified Paenibacillus]